MTLTHIIPTHNIVPAVIEAAPAISMCGVAFQPTTFPELALEPQEVPPADICIQCVIATNNHAHEDLRRAT